MVGVFAISICRGELSAERYKDPLVSDTVVNTISNLTASFLDDNRSDPRHSAYGKSDQHISNIIK